MTKSYEMIKRKFKMRFQELVAISNFKLEYGKRNKLIF